MSTILQGRPGVRVSVKSGWKSGGKEERTLDDDVTVLAKGGALHGEGRGGPSRGLEGGEG